MDNKILIGLLVGLTFTTTLFVWNSQKFNKTLRIVLTLFVVFPPIQWAIIIIILIFKSFDFFNSESENKLRTSKASINDLLVLKNKGLISENEFKQKVEKLEADKFEVKIKQSDEYKKLKWLFDSKVLTEEEFSTKVKMLHGIYNHNNVKTNTFDDNLKNDKKEFFDKNENQTRSKKPINLLSFEGRINRSVFIKRYFLLFFFLLVYSTLNNILYFLLKSHHLNSFLTIPAILFYFWFWFAQGAKRCHDLGKSGWWQFIPLYIFWMIFKKGNPQKNLYGESIK